MSVTKTSGATEEPSDRRKLVAVLYADMVGYSRLIGLDDAGTLQRLRTLRRNLIDPAIEEHGGRIVQTGGDSLLIVFDSIDGAVRCAVKVQQQVPASDGDQTADRAIRFRVGINVGDVIPDGTDVHGDVVNVAARLQTECPPGGICVSRAVRDHVRGRLDLAFEELGSLNLKNISRLVEAFVLRLEPEGAEFRGRSAKQIPPAEMARPRLSVLVASIQGQGLPREYECLVQSITEDVTADLSRLPGSFVVGRADGTLQSGDLAGLRMIARDLGVCYVLQGSMRKIGVQITVNMQLISTESGAHVWAERFQIDSGDLVGVHDEIAGRLVRIFTVKLIEDVNRRIERIDPQNWTPDDLVMRGRSLLIRPISAANRSRAVGYFERALDADPDSIGARMGVAGVLISNLLNGWTEAPEHDSARAERLLTGILHDDADNAEAHSYMGSLRRIQGRLVDSRIELEIAIGLAPNNVRAISQLGITLAFLGQPQSAISHLERSLRLAPHDLNTPVNQAIQGLCRILLGDIDGAVDCLRMARAGNPQLYYIHLLLASALALRDELDEDNDALRQAIEIRPEIGSQAGLNAVLRKIGWRHFDLLQNTNAGLIRAGLPLLPPNST
jgi:adenylate cyclase